MTVFVNIYYIRISYIALQGPDETDRRVEDSEEQLESNGDLNGGSGLLVEPRERKKGEVRNFERMMMILTLIGRWVFMMTMMRIVFMLIIMIMMSINMMVSLKVKANGEVDVHRGLVINSKQAAVERVHSSSSSSSLS